MSETGSRDDCRGRREEAFPNCGCQREEAPSDSEGGTEPGLLTSAPASPSLLTSAPTSQRESETRRCTWVAVFALAMAWVEAAAVFYLRSLVKRVEPYQPDPLPGVGGFGEAELVRELATLVMLAAVGALAGRTARSRFGYACVAFGVWDIAYYAFLKALTGWPRSLLDWDILFLIPLPWWGPVLAPVLITVLLLAGGALLGLGDRPERPLWPARLNVWAGALGVGVALAAFMADAARALPGGEAAIRATLPARFPWPWFLLAWALMAAPVVDLIRQAVQRRREDFEQLRAATAPTP